MNVERRVWSAFHKNWKPIVCIKGAPWCVYVSVGVCVCVCLCVAYIPSCQPIHYYAQTLIILLGARNRQTNQ